MIDSKERDATGLYRALLSSDMIYKINALLELVSLNFNPPCLIVSPR